MNIYMQLATFVKRIAIYDKSFCEVFTIMFLVRGHREPLCPMCTHGEDDFFISI